jgi:hypothetical protein
MENQNITLSIRKDLLRKVKHLAIEKNTSVSGLLTVFLEKLVSGDEEYQLAQEHFIREMKAGYDLGIEPGSFSRDELHDRK